jgi:hypothetical protein
MLNGDAHQILEVEELRIRPVALSKTARNITQEVYAMSILVF